MKRNVLTQVFCHEKTNSQARHRNELYLLTRTKKEIPYQITREWDIDLNHKLTKEVNLLPDAIKFALNEIH